MAEQRNTKETELSPSGFFGGMPQWIKGIVYLLCVPTVVATLSIMMLQMALQIPFGPIFQEVIQKALNDQERVMLEAIEKNQNIVIDAVRDSIYEDITTRLDAVDARLTSIEETAVAASNNAAAGMEAIDVMAADIELIDGRLRRLEDWTCGPIMVDGDVMNDPDWCLE